MTFFDCQAVDIVILHSRKTAEIPTFTGVRETAIPLSLF